MTENRGNKVVSRTVAIALGLVCVVLAASLVVVFANGTVFGSSSDDKQTITDLQTQVSDQTSQISNLNAQITILQNQLSTSTSNSSDYAVKVANLTSTINTDASILALNESAVVLDNETITQNANATTSLFADTVSYAGYAKVDVSATSNTTYVQAVYTCAGATYNQTVTLGTNGTAYLPILPSTVSILLGNLDTETNNATVTLTYYY
jgi:hypothetical protein